ncbi:MAG TPA: LysR family transcriptional regulator [Polyangiaceae bacterium]|jgi:DNA-binding transcriptional LysR family regulator|nr:LysR family transcriptional regulator [Polyangiaceae bacterium]
MAAKPTALDWSLVQAFLAVAEQGSLSAAARFLNASQPTVGRQIKAMEEQLGSELFFRRDKGLVLTETGTSILDAARAMRQAVHQIELSAVGHAERLEGAVRITASRVVAVHHLPPLIAKIRSQEPLISIDLVASDSSSNLHFREADIAVRMYRPTQLDLVTRHLGVLKFGAFAAKSYLEQRGLPKGGEDMAKHDVIGMDKETLLIDGFRAAGVPVVRDWFKVRTDNPHAQWALACAGVGILFGQRSIARQFPDLVEIELGLELPKLPVWLTSHEAVLQTPRVKRVWEILVEGLQALCEADAETI